MHLENGFVQVPLIIRHDRNVKPGMLFTYITIRGHWNNDDPLGCFPGLDILAFETGFQKETVSRHIQKLKELGHLKVIHRYNNSNIYGFPSETKSAIVLSSVIEALLKGIYMDYCIEHLDELRFDEEELEVMYKNIYDKNPKIEDLERFIKDIEIAKQLKVDKNDDKSV